MSQEVIETTVETILTVTKRTDAKQLLVAVVQKPGKDFNDYIRNMLKASMQQLAMRTGEVRCMEYYNEAIQKVIEGLAQELEVKLPKGESS